MLSTRTLRQFAIGAVCLMASFSATADTAWHRVLLPQSLEVFWARFFLPPLAERLAEKDKAVIQASIDHQLREDIYALDQELERIFTRRYDNEPAAKALQRQFANAVSIELRRAYFSRPLQTERQALRDSPLALIDVALGRQMARYAKAVVNGDQQAQMDILTELQNGLLVLSANQAELYAMHLGRVLQEETAKLFTTIEQPEQRKAAMLALLNPALLVFDTIKHRGPNPLYEWLQQYQPYFENVAAAPEHLYLFDRIAGVMVGFENTEDILGNIEALLDPANIAWGHCALGQMAARGVRTGNFGCGMGPQCRSPQTNVGKLVYHKIPRKVDYRFKKVRLSRVGLVSPYGVNAAAMQGSCLTSAGGTGGASGAGGGASGAGGGGMASPGGFVGCLVNAAFRKAAATGGACRLNAAQKHAGRGLDQALEPVIRGIYGQGDCGTNPHMAGGVWSFGGGSNGPDGEKVTREEIDRFADALSDADSGGIIRAIIEGTSGREFTERDFDRMAGAVRGAEVCTIGCWDDPTKPGGTFGYSSCGVTSLTMDEPCALDITVNVPTHVGPGGGGCFQACREEVFRTLLHEIAAHISGMLGATPDNYDTSNEAAEHNSYNAALDATRASQDVADTAESIIDAISDEQKMPGPGSRYEMCGPAAEALQDMMQCAAGSIAGVDGAGNPIPLPDAEAAPEDSGLGNTDGNMDPSMEQWLSKTYGNNVFSSCTQQHGINIVGQNGNTYVIGGGSGSSGQQCGALDCMPPARARSVNGLCSCVASDGAAAAVQAAIARNHRLNTCGTMTVNCDANPGSPCCGGIGGGAGMGGTPVLPGGDPRVFDLETEKVFQGELIKNQSQVYLDAVNVNAKPSTGDSIPENRP